jgi:hypothetical protein
MNEDAGLQMDEIGLSRSGAQENMQLQQRIVDGALWYVSARIGWGVYSRI